MAPFQFPWSGSSHSASIWPAPGPGSGPKWAERHLLTSTWAEKHIVCWEYRRLDIFYKMKIFLTWYTILNMQHQLQGAQETVWAAHSGQDACLNVSGFSSVFWRAWIYFSWRVLVCNFQTVSMLMQPRSTFFILSYLHASQKWQPKCSVQQKNLFRFIYWFVHVILHWFVHWFIQWPFCVFSETLNL